MSDYLKKEDYEEPACVFCKPETIKRIDSPRVIEKLDEYLSRADYPSAERHLNYWLEEARINGDGRGQITVYSELVGLYRKLGRRDDVISQYRHGLQSVFNGGKGDAPL